MALTQQEHVRYSRHIMMDDIGEYGQLKLKHAKIVIVGMGGLGCPAAQYLVAAGIGKLILIDHDVIEISNLQRQVLYNTDDIGQFKVHVAKNKLQAQNPQCDITAINTSVFDCQLSDILSTADLVLDCTDNTQTRQFINRVCVTEESKLVSTSATQHAGQLVSFDLGLPNSPCYHCLFPNDMPAKQNCSTQGVFSPLLGVMGSLQAVEALKLVLGKYGNLNKLIQYDAWSAGFQSFSVKKDEQCAICNIEE